MFFAQSDWFSYLGRCCTINLRAKQDGVQFCLRYRRTFFSTQRSRCVRQHQKSNEILELSIKRYVFFYFLAINVIRMCFKMFCLQMMRGDKQTYPVKLEKIQKNIYGNIFSR